MHTMRYAGSNYSGAHMHPTHHQHHGHGFCHGCHHPVSKCCCSRRDCRKESKELLVMGTDKLGKKTANTEKAYSLISSFAPFMSNIKQGTGAGEAHYAEETKAKLDTSFLAQANHQIITVGTAETFIGGGCCAHLSIEYTPTADPAAIVILARESDNTLLVWAKLAELSDGYQVKECIISTKPGTHLNVAVINMTARVRWCEIFSC